MTSLNKMIMSILAFSFLAMLTPAKAEPVPLDYFAVREAISNVQVSPDGKYLALMKTIGREGNPIIEIYEAADLSKEPFRIGADPMEITAGPGLQWVSDDYLFFSARQKIRNRIEGFNNGVYAFRTAGYSMSKKKFLAFGDNTALVNVLPNDPDRVLISVAKENGSPTEGDPFAAFRPRAYYKLNLNTGAQSLVLNGTLRVGSAFFDEDANPRLGFGYDEGTREFIYYGRAPGERQWTEFFRQDGYSFENFSPQGFDKNDPTIAYIVANNGNDLAGLWRFDTKSGQFLDLVFRDNAGDVAFTRTNSNYWRDGSYITGAIYYGEKFETHWIDEQEEALFQQLEAVIPNAHQLSVTSMSRDGGTFTVTNSGPKDPGSFYLVRDGSLAFIGNQYPLLKPEDLSEVEYIKYPARDGRLIPAYVTVPKGEGPFPLVVLPHGGPYVGEVIIYDEWSQLLANNGFMVIQPQYRGSQGYGIDHFISSINEHGFKMQDDKDDGALYLIRQGRVDPDRVAMFGWSYGGYAALVAASRTPQIYQCTVAGAAVSDPTMQFNYYKRVLRPFEKEFEEQRRSGISPIEEVEKVNIPLLLVHGDVDQRVPFEHYTKYKRELERYNKEADYLVLEGADHFSSTLFYRHQIAFFSKMVDYLKNDCGPGGL